MVFKREDALKSVVDGLAWLEASCRLRGLLHLFDNNVLSHHFLCRLLNGLYGYKLELMDRIQSNFPAIDLGDTENRKAYQVTTEKSGTKVQHTLDKFVEHELHAKFDKLKVLVIGERQGSYTALTIPKEITFDPGEDIIDLGNLVKDAEALTTPELEKLAPIFDEELNNVKRQAAPLVGVTLTGVDAATADETASVTIAAPPPVDYETRLEKYVANRKLARSSAEELRGVFALVGKAGREGVAAAEFNRELDAHLKEYREWLECVSLLERVKAHTFHLQIWAVNESEAVADDLVLTLTFPPQCANVSESAEQDPSGIQSPPPPGPPKRPSPHLSDFVHAGASVTRVSTRLPDLTLLAQALSPDRAKLPHTITFKVDRLRPGETCRAKSVAVVMDPAAVAPIDVRYTVHGANIPKPGTGTLRVEVQPTASPPPT